MATINIRRDVQDSFYRYKMPRLISKIEGKGNGIKTVIPNMTEIAKALNRPPLYPTKYFGCELGAQTKYEEKNERYIVNGAHDAEKLQSLLDGFITRFVLCNACQNPETDLSITKEGIVRNCKACGQRTNVDMGHKLTTFIIKNPPPPVTAYGKKAKKEDENDQEENDDELTRKIQAEAATLNERKVDEEDWVEDTSEEAQAKRMLELSSGIQKNLLLGSDDDDEEKEGSKYEKFGVWLEENLTAGNSLIEEKADEFGVSGKHKTVQVLVQALFDQRMAQQIPQRVTLLQKFVVSEKAQKSLLGGLERLFGITHPKELKRIPTVLKVLYDTDLVDEEVVLKWGSKPSKKYVEKEVSKAVKKAAEPFLNWLKEAEEESDD